MKKILILTFSIFLITFSSDSFAKQMRIKSDDIKNSRPMDKPFVFNGFGCHGGNLSPQFSFLNIPKQAKSLAFTMYDPDAPTGSGWWHWIVYNIDPSTTTVERGNFKITQDAAIGRNDYGKYAYGGPCPPAGTTHRYTFTLYALNVEKLDVGDNPSAALIGYNLKKHAIRTSAMTVNYHRKKF